MRIQEKERAVRTSLWIAVIAAAGALAFLVGFAISKQTGVEPGYFTAVEAAGYGARPSGAAPGLTKDQEKYYRELQQQ
jgi:uncharacterized membrane protein YiaA